MQRVFNNMKIKGNTLVVKVLNRTKNTAEEYAKKLTEEHFELRSQIDARSLSAVKTALGPLLESSKDDEDIIADIEKFQKTQSLVQTESVQENRKYLKRVLDDMIREDEKIKRQKRAEILGLKDDDDDDKVVDDVEDSSTASMKVEKSESVFQTEQVKFGLGISSKGKMKNLEKPPSVFANNQDDNVSEQKIDELGRVIREVVPLKYSEDDKPLTAESVKEQAHAIAARFKMEKKLKGMSAKQLYDTPMDWDSIENLKLVENTKLIDWISSQIDEYFGEVDESLVKFLLDAIRSRSDSKSMISELEDMLDDDAHRLIAGLWRRLHLGALGVDISTV